MSDLKVSIGADTTDFDRKLRGLTRGLSTFAGALGVGLSVGAGAQAVKGLINDLDAMGKKSKNLGLTTDFVQKLGYAAEISGADFETAANAVKNMQKNISDAKSGSKDAKDAFTTLGVPLEEFEKLNPEEQFIKVSQALNKVEKQSDKTALAMQLFGRSGADLLVLTRNYTELAKELEQSGALIKSEDIEAAEAFNDALTRIGKSLVFLVADSGFLQWLSKVSEGLEATFNSGSKLGAKTGLGAGSVSYRGGFMGFVSNLKDAYLGESEGEALAAFRTQEEEQKLKKAKEEFAKTGKSKRQREDEEKALVAARIEEEKLAKEKAKQEEAQKNLDEKTAERISDMKKELELQELKNKGLEREAAIERALYEARKQNKNLNEEQARQIAEAAGTLFDLEKQAKEVGAKTNEEKGFAPQTVDELTNQFLRVGAYMGGGGVDTQQRQYQSKHLGLLESIKENTKKLGESFELV